MFRFRTDVCGTAIRDNVRIVGNWRAFTIERSSLSRFDMA
jgi:hypothetical protein